MDSLVNKLKGGEIMARTIDCQERRLYIIGSLSQADEIKRIACYYKSTGRYDVRYVSENPGQPLKTSVKKAFRNIIWAERICAVPKPNGTFGDGVTYEIAFAELIGKDVEIVTLKPGKQ